MIRRIANRIVLLSLVNKGSVCCEVGVLRGDYSAKILEICQPSKLILIDDWRQHLHFNGDESREFTRQRFADGLITGQVEIHDRDSVTELGNLRDECLDFCYVDASHTFEAVLADLEAALPKMKTGGLLPQLENQCESHDATNWSINHDTQERPLSPRFSNRS